jgi:Zn-dependent metalloprotease
LRDHAGAPPRAPGIVSDPSTIRRAACGVCSIAPPDLLAHLAAEGTAAQRAAALHTLSASAALRARRTLITELLRDSRYRELGLEIASAGPAKRSVYDAEHKGQSSLPGKLARGDGAPPTGDDAVNEAYDGAGSTYDFYEQIYGRNSIDGNGLEIVSSVHFSRAYDNAFWNGSQMVYGDGSGTIFAVGALTKAIDVIGHELTHGVTQYTAGLAYHGQPGALNESFSDVFGSLLKQWALGQTADQADWLIGAGTLVPELGPALRSMKAPGTAYRGDRQPAHMDDYRNLPDDDKPTNDNGGVHLNSGIPNHAFYLAATAIGGKAWERTGRIWYTTLTERLQPETDFAAAANATVEVAAELFGATEQAAVRTAWEQVGVLPASGG